MVPSSIEHLTPEQRTVLRALVDYPPLWQLDPDQSPLREFSLPTHRLLLRHIVEGAPTGSAPPRIPPAISAPPSVALTPPANAAERIRKIGLAFERHRYLASASAALLAYLNDQVALPEIWEQNRSLYSLCWFTDGVVSLISTGAALDSLDLRLLDVLAILGSAEQFIEAIARQERVAQAFDHLQRQQQRYPRLRGLRSPLAALALVRGSFVESGQPTPLGWLLLASMPERLEQALELRNQAWGPRGSNADDLIELLLAPSPPYIAEALKLVTQMR